jgi:hypothetical protein
MASPAALPVSELLYPIQSLTNLIYLTKHDLENKEKVLRYMEMAEEELVRLTQVAHKLALLNGPRIPSLEN